MSRYPIPSNAPADAKPAPANGSVTSAFDASRLPRSQHPALANTGGAVANLEALIAQATKPSR